MENIRVLIADDHGLVRRGARDLLIGRFVGLVAQQERAIHRHGQPKGAKVILAHQVAQAEVFRAVDVEKLGPRPYQQHLTDLLFQSQRLQRLLRPLFAVVIQLHRAEGLEARLAVLSQGAAGNAHQQRGHQGESFEHERSVT